MAGTRKLELIVTGDAKGGQRALDDTGSSAAGAEKQVESFGKTAGLGLAAVGVGAAKMAKDWVGAATESQKVSKQTEAVIKSMGNQSNISADQVGKLSEKLAMQSGVDDELIQSGENVLLTFGKVRNEVGAGNDIFNRATQSALDMSVALGTDMAGASILVGKALNDPIKGLTALTRSGVSFTQQQKDQVKAMVESGDVMGAQKLILGELDKQFAGSAAAQATAGEKLSVVYGNLQEKIGGALLPVISDLAGGANFLLSSFDKLPESTQGVLTKMVAFGTVGLGAAAGIAFVADKAKYLHTNLGPLIPAMTDTEGGLNNLGKATAVIGFVGAVAGAAALADSFNHVTVDANMLAAGLVNMSAAEETVAEHAILGWSNIGKLDDVIRQTASTNVEAADRLLHTAEAAGIQGDQLDKLRKIVDDKRGADVQGSIDQKKYGEETKAAADAADGQADSLQKLADQLRAQFDPLFAAQSAQQALTAAQQAATTAVKEHGATSVEAIAANDAAVQAAYRYTGSMTALKAAVDAGDVSIDDATSTLQGWVQQGLITQGQANQTATSFGTLDSKARAVTDKVSVWVTAPGLATTNAQLDALIRKVQQAGADVIVNVRSNIAGARAGGGHVTRGMRYIVGEDGPEIFEAPSNGNIVPNDQISTTTGGGWAGVTNIVHVTVEGSVTAERDLAQTIRTELDRTAARNGYAAAIG